MKFIVEIYIISSLVTESCLKTSKKKVPKKHFRYGTFRETLHSGSGSRREGLRYIFLNTYFEVKDTRNTNMLLKLCFKIDK